MKKFIFLIFFLMIISRNLFSQQLNPSIQLFGSPLVHIYEKTEGANYNQNFCYSFGIFIKNRFNIDYGSFSIRVGYFIDNNDYKKKFSDTIAWYPRSVQTKFLYGNIPLFFDYNYDFNDKLSSFISIGFIFGHILYQEQHWIYNNGTTQDGFRNGIENEMNPKYFHLSLGLDYKISNKYSIQLEPYLKYRLNGKSPYNYDIDSKIAIGTRLGIKYDIKN